MPEKHRAGPAKDQTPETDPLNLAIASALVHHLLPPLTEEEEAELECGAEALTDADRTALEALGSPTELVDKLRSERDQKERQAEAATHISVLDSTQPAPGSRFWDDSDPQSYEDLLNSMEAFHKEELLTWTSCYHMGRELGRGFQGVVYLTQYQDAMNGLHAMKIFSPKPYGNAISYREDMERMSRVASVLHSLHHENLVDAQRFLEYQGLYVMVMQWIDGYDLRQLMRTDLVTQIRNHVSKKRWDIVFTTGRNGQLCLQPGVAVHIIEKCLRGLDAMHSRNVVHGDIKPSNIMLGRYGSCRLVDLGSAFEVAAPPQERTWTPAYAAPEFLEKGRCTPQSDLASLGYILVELLSGQPAVCVPSVNGEYSTRTMNGDRDPTLLEAKRELPDRFPELLSEGAGRGQRLKALIRHLIAVDPQDRFSSATEAIEGLDGTFNFNKELTQGDLVVHYEQEIKRWLAVVQEILQ